MLNNELKNSTNGLPTIGQVFWWTIRDLKVPVEDLQDLIQKHHLKDVLEVEEKESWQAFIKACRNYKEQDIFLRKKQLGHHSMRFSFYHGQDVSGEDSLNELLISPLIELTHVEQNQQINIVCRFRNKDGNIIVCSLEEAAGRIREHYDSTDPNYFLMLSIVTSVLDEYRNLMYYVNSFDFRSALVQAVAKMQGTKLRPTGGIYFIPESYKATLENLENLCQELTLEVPGEAEVFSFGVLDNAKARRAIFSAFLEDFLNECDTIVASVKEASNDRKVRSATIKKRLKELQEIEVKGELYQNLLQNVEVKIAQKIQESKQELVNLLMSLGENDEVPDTEIVRELQSIFSS